MIIQTKDQALYNYFRDTDYLSYYDNGQNEVDFLHILATISALMNLPNSLTGELGQNLAGWAGDLQSIIPEIMNGMEAMQVQDYRNIYDITLNGLRNNTLKNFGYDDFLADIDAYNIFKIMDNKIMDNTFSKSIAESVSIYYEEKYQSRCSLFCGDWDYEKIHSVVKEYVSMPLVLGDFMILNAEQKQAFADAFTDFLWEQIQGEISQ